MDGWHSVHHYWQLHFYIWAAFAFIAVALSARIVLLSWNRARWNIVDTLALFLPFAIWLWGPTIIGTESRVKTRSARPCSLRPRSCGTVATRRGRRIPTARMSISPRS